jgi:hypothetical protein
LEGESGFNKRLADPVTGAHRIHTTRAFTECVFIDRDFYLQTISDHDETVLAFSVTTRRRRFAPTFEGPRKFSRLENWRIRRRIGEKWSPLFRIKLGRTRCSEIEPDGAPPARVRAWLGARLFHYNEFRYWGNPGSYQTYVFSANSSGPRVPLGNVAAVQQEIDNEWDSETNTPDWASLPLTHKFRRETAITYTVVAQTLWVENFPTSFGAFADAVRTPP